MNDTVTTVEENLRLRIFDGTIPLDEAGTELLAMQKREIAELRAELAAQRGYKAGVFSAPRNTADAQYLRIMRKLLDQGVRREGRNGVTFGLFGEQMRFDLTRGFPLLTTKKVHFKSVLVELLWFLRGDTNVKFLHDHGVTIWDEWADERGNLGPVYGDQWRHWEVDGDKYDYRSDQIANLLDGLRKDPFSRRHVVTAWNPAEIDLMALPPCHCLFQFHVAPGSDGKPKWLSCHLYQRSADWFLGVPFNIASYALLTHLVAREVGLIALEFIHSFGDLHLYENHRSQALTQLLREPVPLPTINVSGERGIFDLQPEDIWLSAYNPWPAISAPVSK